MAGISKVILAIRKAQITPNLHLESLNPNIDLGGFNTLMPDKLVEWKSASIRSGVSSFGSLVNNLLAVVFWSFGPLRGKGFWGKMPSESGRSDLCWTLLALAAHLDFHASFTKPRDGCALVSV